MSRNNVRGPTSALTEFLRSQNITPTTVARRAGTRQNGNQDRPVAGPSREAGENEDIEMGAEEEQSSPRRRTRRAVANNTSGYNSDNLDDDEPEDGAETEATPAKKRKLTKAAEAKLKAKEKEKAKKKKGKKGDGDDDYEDDDGEENAYSALSKMWSAGGAKPPVGSFEDCAKCGKQFTVTKYTMACIPGPGFLCHPCAKASGSDPFKKSAAPKRKKAPADKRTVINFEEKRFPTLVSVCIQLITKHIDDIEAFGDIGAVNMDAISKALSKARALTPTNAPLFYNAESTSLTLYDATNLNSPAFESLVYLNPSLTTLRLDYCGQLDDAAMGTLASSLPALTSIELLGPFLVRAPAWTAFLTAHPALTTFRITQSPRFDLSCLQTLAATSAPTLLSLRLKEVGQLNDAFLHLIRTSFPSIQHLDLSSPAQSCSQPALLQLLEAAGPTLRHLDLGSHDLLDDAFLEHGLRPHAARLEALGLARVPGITDGGVGRLFEGWSASGAPPLRSVCLARNAELGSAALMGILRHSGTRLERLDINGWKDVGEEALRRIGELAPELERIDVGWCREVDDFVVKDWLLGDHEKGITGCARLREVKVWGCNRISAACLRKPGVSIVGVESQMST